jgi:hypothetical protein
MATVATKKDIRQTADGGFVVVGEQAPGGFGASNDVFGMKLTAQGDTSWTKRWGAPGSGDNGRSVTIHKDGGYVMGGYTNSFGAGNTDIWFAVADVLGSTGGCYSFNGASDLGWAAASSDTAALSFTSGVMNFSAQTLTPTSATLEIQDFELELVGASGPSGAGMNDGYALVLVTGGAWPYTYQWNDTQGQTTQIATGLAPGTYTVLVTDGSGCSASIAVVVFEATGLPTIEALKQINIMPNPATERFQIVYSLSEPTDLKISLLNHIGQVIKTDRVEAAYGTQSHQMNVGGVPAGLYYVRISTDKGQVVRKLSVQ